MIKVAIADDHKIFRDGLKLLFRKGKDFELTGEAANGIELLEVIDRTHPDIVLTDIKMPEMDGITAVREISQRHPKTMVIALSMFDEESLVKEMLEAGARGYLLKDAGKNEIIDAIHQVLSGRPCFSNTFSRKLVELLSSSNYNPYPDEPPIEFTQRELDIIQCICKELTSKEIAEKLNLSTRTVEWYRLRTMEKVGAKSSTGVVVYAMKHNLVTV